MGIVNLTDNSYFAQSRCLGSEGNVDLEKAMGRIAQLLEEGAEIIDIGACSTRPGSDPVGEQQEWERLEPTLKAAWRRWPELVISIDTYWASVAAKAYGVAIVLAADPLKQLIINDISAGEDDPQMLGTVGRLGLTYIAMHKRGTPKTMQQLTDYQDVTQEIVQYFRDFAQKAKAHKIENWIIDPGFGFAKTAEQNYELLKNLKAFEEFGKPILVGVSRKSMIYRLYDITPEQALPQTQILHYVAIKNGATILRVHDAAETKRTIHTTELL